MSKPDPPIVPRPRLARSFETWRDWWFGYISQPNPDRPKESRFWQLLTPWPRYAPFATGDAAVESLRELFERSHELIPRFGAAAVAEGLWHVACLPQPGYVAALWHEATDEHRATSAIAAMYELFAKLFAVHCDRVMSSGESDTSGPLNLPCYMWFDVIGLDHCDTRPIPPARLRAAIGVLRRILSLPHIACQESALHGLGHIAQFDPALVLSPIDNFLHANRTVPAQPRQYAECARVGTVL